MRIFGIDGRNSKNLSALYSLCIIISTWVVEKR